MISAGCLACLPREGLCERGRCRVLSAKCHVPCASLLSPEFSLLSGADSKSSYFVCSNVRLFQVQGARYEVPGSHFLIFSFSHFPIFPFSHFLIFSFSHFPIFHCQLSIVNCYIHSPYLLYTCSIPALYQEYVKGPESECCQCLCTDNVRICFLRKLYLYDLQLFEYS